MISEEKKRTGGIEKEYIERKNEGTTYDHTMEKKRVKTRKFSFDELTLNPWSLGLKPSYFEKNAKQSLLLKLPKEY